MDVDNGDRRRLYIEDVFDGECGISRGVVGFRPNGRRKPMAKEACVLGGQVAVLTDITPSADGQFYTAHYQIWVRE